MSGYDRGSFRHAIDRPFLADQQEPGLRRAVALETNGYIVGTHIEQDNRPDKRRYELTPAGSEALDSWLKTNGSAPDRTRSGFLAKFFFAQAMTWDQRLRLLKEYRAEVESYRLELQEIADKLEDRPDAVYGRATALYSLLTAEAKINWADQTIQSLSDHPPVGRRRPRR